MKIKITSDSTCDLSNEQIEQNKIGIFRLSVVFGEKSYKDGELSPQDIFDFVKESGTLPKTAAGSQTEYFEFFTENVSDCDALIHFNISAQASSSYSAASKAAEEFGGKVFTVDSRALSTGQGLLVLKACGMAEEGYSAAEIVETVNSLRVKVNTSFVPDDTEEGKLLRLRQEYFFSAAAVGELIEKHVKLYGRTFHNFADFNVIQLNDTHPVLAIAEFIRILIADYQVSFSDAVEISRKTFAYTNHTIMPEALECWDAGQVKKILPDIYALLIKLHLEQKEDFDKLNCSDEEASDMAIYSSDRFSMANLAVYIGKTVNGVAKLHTEILKDSLFRTAYRYYPEKFQNKTNGITQRRWLMLCNRELSALIDNTIGKEWRSDISLLCGLNGHIPEITNEFVRVKAVKRKQLFDYIKKHEGIDIPENFIVYSQVKRLH